MANRRRVLEMIHDICEQYETNLKNGVEVNIAEWIDLVGSNERAELFFELLRLEAHYASESPGNSIGEWFNRFPEFSNEIVKVFATNRRLGDEESLATSQQCLSQIEPGEHIGRFQVISVLGAGGFAVVYLAHDPELNQAVALKVLNVTDKTDSQHSVECLINEANVLSQIDHPLIPKVHDIGEDEQGNPWVAMEFIKGKSLYELLTTEHLSDVETLRILVKTARALGEIHKSGFTHRDIKPDNIIIGIDGEPRICDYGLAIHEDVQRDRSGERAGTTCYMSPEQVMGRSENLDGRTDVWSLGVILYLVVAKRLPFQGENKQEVRESIVHQPVKPPRQIRGNVATIQLENICLKALKKDPEERYRTAEDFADAIQDAIDSLPVEFLLREASKTRRLTGSEQRSILLATKARCWNSDPSVGNLPGLYRYFQYQLGTDRSLWTDAESQMMAASSRHFLRVGAAVAVLALVFVYVQFQIRNSRNDGRVRDVVQKIKTCPIGEVEATFKHLSAFAPEKCHAGVEEAFKEESDSTDEKLKLAIALSARDPQLQGLFRESLLNAQFEEIDTLSKLAFANGSDSELTLDDDSKRKLGNIIAKTPLVRGLERIWPDAPTEFVESFESFEGEMTTRYAWCGKMPLEKFQSLCEEMRQYRYRPVCVRPWLDEREKEIVVSAIWHRSSADWKIGYNLTPDEFISANAREPMNLIDVSDGLQLAEGKPEMVAVWSNLKDPLGNSRLMLLAQRIPVLAEQLTGDTDNYGIISHDVDGSYLQKTPMLVDVSVHQDTQYEPLSSREHQKIHVGEMIIGTCQPESNVTPDSNVHKRLQSGKNLVGRAWFALGKFELSSKQFQNRNFDGTWQDILMRTRSFAMAGNAVSANHSKANLLKKMKASVLNITKPFLTVGEARAITTALQTEMDFWETRNTETFIERINVRIRRLESRKKNPGYSLATEYYSMAYAAHSVNLAVSALLDEESEARSQQLKQLTEKLIQKSLKIKPALQNNFVKWYGIQSVQRSPFIHPDLRIKKLPVHSSAWTTFASNFESRFIQPRTNRHHLVTCQGLKDGFIPVSIVLGKTIGGEARKGSIWHRELESDQLARREQQVANALCYALVYNEDIGIWRILSNPDDCTLKQTVVDTIHQFGIDLTILLDRLDQSNDEPERVSILEALRHYSVSKLGSKDVDRMIESVKLIESAGTEQEKKLCRIIRLNIDPLKMADSPK